MPSFDSTSEPSVLRRATEAEQFQRDLLTHSAWGQKLSVEAYQLREKQLRGHAWARDVMTSWLFTSSGGTVLSSCETFRMPAVLAGGESGNIYGVASVFTEPALRGRAHARDMMRALNETVAQMDPHALGMLLFSDVGEALYARAGYVPLPAFDWRFPARTGEPRDAVDALISETQLHDACARMVSANTGLRLFPTAPQIDWHLERERAYAELLSRARPLACGARIGDSTILWACSFKSDELVILAWHCTHPREAAALVKAAQHVAWSVGLKEVCLWETADEPGLQLQHAGGVRRPRDGSLPMVCPLNPMLKQEDLCRIPRGLWV